MAKSNTKIIYNKEEDILNISKGKPSKASIEIGDFIIDIDFNGFVSGIEILNASENLGISPSLLSNIKKASISVIYKPSYIKVSLTFILAKREKEVVIPLTIDLGHKKLKKEVISII